jgi:hypothetical protein
VYAPLEEDTNTLKPNKEIPAFFEEAGWVQGA